MELPPIRTKRDYEAALKQAEAWWNAPAGSINGKKLDVLTLLIADYEAHHFPIEPPDPVEFILFILEQRGLSRKDLEPFIGSRARVAEVLNRVRPLSLEMIRNLSEGLGLPADVLVQRYALKQAA